MRPNCPKSIAHHLADRASCPASVLWGAATHIPIGGLLQGTSTSLSVRRAGLAGRSVLIATRDQLAAALALIELDGVAARLVICTPDIRPGQLPRLIAECGVDAMVSDWDLDTQNISSDLSRVSTGCALRDSTEAATQYQRSEWVLLTSGTSGAPKTILHDFASLAAPIGTKNPSASGVVWGTFYDIRRYGGLQIFLRAVLSNSPLLLSHASEPVQEHLRRLGALGATHISGTPSHWRRVLMSGQAHRIAPRYIRLSGEIADQAVLDSLRSFYPNAAISHAFASTEAGVAFEVTDGLEGFPASALGTHGDIEIQVVNDTLRVRSNRTAVRYLGGEQRPLRGEDGFVDTGDVVARRGDRCYFLGRGNGVINVGGLKVYAEEVEAVINRHPAIRMSRVRPRKNPITGAVVSAEIVLKDAPDSTAAAARFGNLTSEVMDMCRHTLPPYKVPVSLRFVAELEVGAGGKLVRNDA